MPSDKTTEPPATLDDLSMLVRRLVHRLRKHEPDSVMAQTAVDYLRRKGLQGSPLRHADALDDIAHLISARHDDQRPNTAALADAVARAEFAGRLAERLLMFPLAPQPGDTLDEHARALQVTFTYEITKALNEEAARHAR